MKTRFWGLFFQILGHPTLGWVSFLSQKWVPYFCPLRNPILGVSKPQIFRACGAPQGFIFSKISRASRGVLFFSDFDFRKSISGSYFFRFFLKMYLGVFKRGVIYETGTTLFWVCSSEPSVIHSCIVHKQQYYPDRKDWLWSNDDITSADSTDHSYLLESGRKSPHSSWRGQYVSVIDNY